MKTLWFKRKTYGWGWTPATWQGWLVLVAFIALEVLNFFRLHVGSKSNNKDVITFVIESLFLVGVLLFICYKTGESPKWQWGEGRVRKVIE